MSHQAGPAPQFSNRKAARLMAVGLLFIVAGLFGGTLFAGCGEAVSALTPTISPSVAPSNLPDRQAGSAPATTTKERTIDWIELPMDLKSWESETTDWIEFEFLNGCKKRFGKGEKAWWKETPARTLKVRGGGPEVTILIRQ
ncbi:MAG: hypothetical protein UY02_C0041G0008 [Candidatus Giovannonibacteria bacterium GW2011_GWB1_47_6b]|uniref:Uncharacterized protein n=1 Tax=Candidatus Giovannonibacteria bacterium GW2011_GWB1_47_6b TaxID=1618655 RepID=A0A0G1T269_9BACT|nr:MAG: hypothetical protein UY02_C0041G0008 [Candidatus Giovannonibacteria bacterium GW2011_GWB1_47_6b]